MSTYIYSAVCEIKTATFGGNIVSVAPMLFCGNPVRRGWDSDRLVDAQVSFQNRVKESWAGVPRPAYLVHEKKDGSFLSGSPVYAWEKDGPFFSDGSGELDCGRQIGVLVVSEDGSLTIESMDEARVWLSSAPNWHNEYFERFGEWYKGKAHFCGWLAAVTATETAEYEAASIRAELEI